MLVGKSYHSLDAQRRLTIPKHMRTNLGDEPMLTRGLDGGIFLLPQAFWTQLVNNLEHQPFTKKRARDFLRLLSNDAYAVTPDSLGRITLPESLAQVFGLQRDIVIVGSLQYIEIWDRDRYHTYVDSIAASAEEIAESMEWKDENAYSGYEA